MTDREKKISKWVLPITVTILGPVVSFILDFLKDKPIFSTIWSWLNWLYNFLISFLNFSIKVWIILLVLVIILLVLWIWMTMKNIANRRPPFTEYKQDIVKTWKWKWDWKFNSYKKYWEIIDLHACCPKCDTRLQVDYYMKRPYSCPRCGFVASQYYEKPGDIEHLINDNIDRNDYPRESKGEKS